jgi:hypothetical protein
VKREIWKAVFVLAALWSLVNVARCANIVTNGDFEAGTTVDAATGDVLPSGWVNGPPSPSTLSKVNVGTAVNAAIDLGPESGTHYIRYQSPATNGTADCLLQDLTTVSGQKYAVSFWIAATSTSAGNPSGINPVWDENRGNQTSMAVGPLFAPATNTGPLAYQSYSFVETASASVTRLDFHGTDVSGSILLDNVVVAPIGPGDYNANGIVDAADYVAWREGLGTTYTQNDYNVWRANFGQTAGSGAGAMANAAVPEPATLLQIILVAAVVYTRRRKPLRKSQQLNYA